MAKLTMIGLYNFDNTVFENLTLPEGIDRETCIGTILVRSGEFELLYPDLDYLKAAIGLWSSKHQRTFAKWIEALNLEYNPLDNYDRTEEITDTGAERGTSSRQGSNSSQTTKQTSEQHDVTNTNGGTSQNDVYAYDQSSIPSPKDRRTDSFTSRDAGSSSVSDGGSVSGSETESGTNNKDTETHHTARIRGNIGVTTSMQLLKEQLALVEWNVYDHIADLFVDEFCIQVYW